MELFSSHLLVLHIIIPMIAACICAMISSKKWAWRLSSLACAISSLVSIVLWIMTRASEPLYYAIGGWAAPIGIEYKLDALGALILIMVSFIALLSIVSSASIANKAYPPTFYAIFLLCLAGLSGMVLSHDIFNIYVFLEISSIASYILASQGQDKKSLVAAFYYILAGSLAAMLVLLGISMLYAAVGTLNIGDLRTKLAPILHLPTVKAGCACILIGFIVKLGVILPYGWLPRVYALAPSSVTILLVGASGKVSLYMLIKLIFGIFGLTIMTTTYLYYPLLTISCLAMLGAGLRAVQSAKTNISSTLAFSSIAQTGYIILAFSIGTTESLVAMLLLIIAHSLAKTALFMMDREHYHNRLFLAINCASMAGIPLTTGFIGKWILLSSIANQHLWLVLTVVSIASVLTAIYCWKIWENFPNNNAPRSRYTSLPIIFLSLINLIIGTNPSALIKLLGSMAENI